MWLIISRAPLPDMAHWPGRTLLATIDALAWPLLWIWLAHRHAVPMGVFAPLIAGLASLAALRRLHRAVLLNHRYRFTTWRWGKFVMGLVVIGMAMKLVMLP